MKFFPAATSGGPAAIAALAAPFGGVTFGLFDPRTPALPTALRRAIYMPPRSRRARDFTAAVLPVQRLTPEAALDEVLTHVGRFPLDAEVPGVLDFLERLWQMSPATLSAADRRRLARVPVPARSIGTGSTRGFVVAGSVYFPRRWTGNETLERLYGPFRRQEFLAIEPPGDLLAAARRFWIELGVSDSPRPIPIDRQRPSYFTWWDREDVIAAWRCPDDHPQSTRQVVGTVMDRLDELATDRTDARTRHALASHLLRQAKPLGDDVRILCTNSAHKRRVGKSAIGYQKWLLLAHPWVPTVGGPGEVGFRRPEEVWVDVPRGAARAVLASPTVPPPDPRAVGFASVHKPELSRLENALLAVEATYAELAAAPPATRDGLSWLVKKIDAAAARANHGGRSVLRWPQDS